MTAKALIIDAHTEIDWIGLELSLHDHFSVNAVTLKKNGHRQTAGQLMWANPLCAMIKTNPKAANRICNTLQKYLMHETETKRRYATEECAAGMYRMVVPVIRNSEVEGFVSVCGRPFSTTDRVHTNYIHRTIDEDEEKIKRLLSSLKPIDCRTIKEMKHLITGYAQ